MLIKSDGRGSLTHIHSTQPNCFTVTVTDKSHVIRIRSMLEIAQEVVTCKQVFIWIKFNTSHANSLNSRAGIYGLKKYQSKKCQ